MALYPKAGTGTNSELAYLGLGLAGEAGEAVDCIKKILRNDGDMEVRARQRDKLFLELGDVAWYWIGLCDVFGFNPEKLLEANIAKLSERKKTGKIKKR